MSVRTGSLGLLGLIAGGGLAVAAPPINPFVEGREPNPVIREFHELEQPVAGYETGPFVPLRSKFGCDQTVMEDWQLFLASLVSSSFHPRINLEPGSQTKPR
jgi:hypothetical protein